jgi:voltage-gated potassium channel
MTAETPPTIARDVAPYQLFMLGMSVFALILVALAASMPRNTEVRQLIGMADNAMCAVFFVDFVYNLSIADNRWRYLRTWGWLDLLASIPAVGVLRTARLARVVRLLRILRVAKATRLLATTLTTHRRQGGFFAAALIAVVVTFSGSISVLQVEQDAPGANILNAEDALWWSVVTVATVGYGDRFPVTTEGRLVATVLMAVGVGLFGTLSGIAASWFAAGGESSGTVGKTPTGD